MNDLHIKLTDEQENALLQLCDYVGTTKTKLIGTFILIAWNCAYTQIRLSKKYPETLPDNLDPSDAYELMHITNIFDEIYGGLPDLEDEEEREIEVEV